MLDPKSLDTIFRQARTHNAFTGPVSDAQLRELYDLLKWGPTTTNTQPARFVFVRSKDSGASMLTRSTRPQRFTSPTSIFSG